MLLYFGIALFGFAVLVITLLIGEADDLLSVDFLDFDGADDVGPFNVKVLAAALTAFGATGMITTYYEWGALPSALTAGGAGIAVGAVAWWLLSLIYRQQVSSQFTIRDLSGQTAEVTTAIPANGIGQVVYTSGTGSKQLLARTRDGTAIAAGRTVLIVDTQGTSVTVVPVE